MKRRLTKLLPVSVLTILLSAHAEDIVMAAALAKAGAEHVVKGHYESAKETLYRALALHENCGDALYSLAQISEREGLADVATEFYRRAEKFLKGQRKVDAGLALRAYFSRPKK